MGDIRLDLYAQLTPEDPEGKTLQAEGISVEISLSIIRDWVTSGVQDISITLHQ